MTTAGQTSQTHRLVRKKLELLRLFGGLNAVQEYERWNREFRVGFIVNPVAGMGGRVGLKGTDGKVQQAIKRGARPVAPLRAVEFLVLLKNLMKVNLYTCSGLMGEKESKTAGFNPVICYNGGSEFGKTTAEDTKKAADILSKNSDIIVFVGGDGTARDICQIVADRVPVLGVPSGVKMYSGVFALNPLAAALVVVEFFRGNAELELREVMDADEKNLDENFSLNLYGYLRVPVVDDRIQNVKIRYTVSDSAIKGVITTFLRLYDPETTYILAPGGTILQLARSIGVKKTLLGVDVVRGEKIIANDVSEEELLSIVEKSNKVKIVVTPIGGNGFIFGRGNQQISPEVIKRVGRNNIVVVSTLEKLKSVGTLKVDTGDVDVDEMLRGDIDVLTDIGKIKMKVQ
jgi:predicted polyphosphate/ATP-dependent NAD kinase